MLETFLQGVSPVSDFSPSSVQGPEQTLDPAHDKALMPVAARQDFLTLFWTQIRDFLYCPVSQPF